MTFISRTFFPSRHLAWKSVRAIIVVLLLLTAGSSTSAQGQRTSPVRKAKAPSPSRIAHNPLVPNVQYDMNMSYPNYQVIYPPRYPQGQSLPTFERTAQSEWLPPLGFDLLSPRSTAYSAAGLPPMARHTYGVSPRPMPSGRYSSILNQEERTKRVVNDDTLSSVLRYRAPKSGSRMRAMKSVERTASAATPSASSTQPLRLTTIPEQGFGDSPTDPPYSAPLRTLSTALPRGFKVPYTTSSPVVSSGHPLVSPILPGNDLDSQTSPLELPPARGVSAAYPIGGIRPEESFRYGRHSPPGLGLAIYDQYLNSTDPTLVDLGSRQQFRIFFGQRIGQIPSPPAGP